MKHPLLLLLFLAGTLLASAQQNTSFREGNITSPVINSDGTVTFRLMAPKAKHVEVLGDWEENDGKGVLKKQKNGVWEYTTPKLPSEMYTYRFLIDGVIGLDPTNPFTRRDVGNQFSIFFIGDGVADLYQVQDVPHGTLVSTWYKSGTAGMQRRLSIYLPPFYDENRDERYPVLYLLHGSGGDETAWVELGNTVRIMDNLIAAGKIRPMMVVMPNGNFSQPAAPGETPDNLSFRPVMSDKIPGNYKNGLYELAFDEIVGFVDANYRTVPKKDARAVAGLSMGGFHTLFIALNHPDMFSYIGLFSAGLGHHFMNKDVKTYAEMDLKLQRLKEEKYRLFWIAIGKDDFLYDVNTEFRKELEEADFEYQYHESSRGHLWSNWRQYLVDFSQMLWK